MKISDRFTAIAAGAAIALFGGVSANASGAHQTSSMYSFADASIIANTEAELTRMGGGLHVTVNSVGLTAGNALTAWFVVFNSPENCSDAECGENDIFNMDDAGGFILNADGSPPMNMDMIEAANISVHRADGLIIDVDGNAQFMGSLVVGDVSEAVFGGGLVDANVAEVHIVLRDHGAAITGSTDEMVNALSGGCSEAWPNEPCTDVQFAVFKHDS